MNNSYKKDFIDEKGNSYTLEAEGEKINFHGKIYKLQHENTKCKKKEGIFTSDIGIHSNGFAGILGLAMILSLAGIIIAYLFWKF